MFEGGLCPCGAHLKPEGVCGACGRSLGVCERGVGVCLTLVFSLLCSEHVWQIY